MCGSASAFRHSAAGTQTESGDVQGTLLLGMVKEELKDYAMAVRLLESAPDEVRKRPESLAALARAYYDTGRQEMARKTLRELPRPSAGPEGVFLGGQVAAELHDYDIAEFSVQLDLADLSRSREARLPPGSGGVPGGTLPGRAGHAAAGAGRRP